MAGSTDVSQFLNRRRLVPTQDGTTGAVRRPEGYAGANGSSRWVVLRDGFALQAIKAEYREDLEFRHVMQPGFGIYLHFEDNEGLDLAFEGLTLPVGRHREVEERPFGFAVWREQPVLFHRRGAKGTRLCVVIVWLSPEWFDETFGTQNRAIPPASREHLAISRWYPSHRVASLAKSLFDPETRSSPVARLRYEIVALELVSEALGTMRAPGAALACRSETLLLNRACDAIATKLEGDLPLGTLARELGVGVRTLGRLFQKAYGCSVGDYVRARRLDAARNMLEEGEPISTVATFAGYTSKTNFSTAFKRRFGVTPGHARTGERQT